MACLPTECIRLSIRMVIGNSDPSWSTLEIHCFALLTPTTWLSMRISTPTAKHCLRGSRGKLILSLCLSPSSASICVSNQDYSGIHYGWATQVKANLCLSLFLLLHVCHIRMCVCGSGEGVDNLFRPYKITYGIAYVWLALNAMNLRAEGNCLYMIRITWLTSYSHMDNNITHTHT